MRMAASSWTGLSLSSATGVPLWRSGRSRTRSGRDTDFRHRHTPTHARGVQSALTRLRQRRDQPRRVR
jgi:hypothetical protein